MISPEPVVRECQLDVRARDVQLHNYLLHDQGVRDVRVLEDGDTDVLTNVEDDLGALPQPALVPLLGVPGGPVVAKGSVQNWSDAAVWTSGTSPAYLVMISSYNS